MGIIRLFWSTARVRSPVTVEALMTILPTDCT